ncbi:hypothetical protein REPUB_Repub04eG0252500 [Reevesia pubescens]
MGTNRFIMLKNTHFDFVFSFMHGFLFRNIWVFLSKFIVFVFGSIIGYFFRFSNNKYLEENEYGACLDSKFDELKEKQSSDHVDEAHREEENSAMVASTSKYEFLYRKGVSGFIEAPKSESYTVHEFYMGSNDYADCNGKILDSRDSVDGDIGKIEFGVEDVIEEKVNDSLENSVETNVIDEKKTEEPVEEKAEDSIETFMVEKILEKEPKLEETKSVFENKTEESALRFFFEKSFEKLIKEEKPVEAKVTIEEKPEQAIETEDIVKEKTEDSVENFIVEQFLEKPKQEIEKEDVFEEKAEESVEYCIIEKSLDFSPRSKVDVESFSYEELADRIDLRPESHRLADGQKVENMEHEETHECNTSVSDHEAATIRGSINDSDDEFIEFEPRSEKMCVIGETQSGGEDDTEPMVSSEKTKQPTLQEESISRYEQEDDSEFGSKPDDLIERLKMELKIARTRGLPTILEESESPKMVEELGPLQIDEKYDHKDHIAEIQKVYKSYSDKMRKLDILNSQTMHAISLLQLKDPVRLSISGKSSAPAIKSLLSHKVLSFKQRKAEADPAMKLTRDLHKDFETVYVGQVCLSWEILYWQYGKVKKLLEFDSHGMHQYNQVAGEFQLLQVLVQRFLEDEPFQTRPRVENYVKNRCAVRHLLQVPVIKGK